MGLFVCLLSVIATDTESSFCCVTARPRAEGALSTKFYTLNREVIDQIQFAKLQNFLGTCIQYYTYIKLKCAEMQQISNLSGSWKGSSSVSSLTPLSSDVIFTQPSLIPSTANETRPSFSFFKRPVNLSVPPCLGQNTSLNFYVDIEKSSPLLFLFSFPAEISTSIQVRA